MPSIERILAFSSILFAVGCASSSPRAEREEEAVAPHPARFAAPAPAGRSLVEEWVGEYRGTVDLFARTEEGWQQGIALQLTIRSGGEERLLVTGEPTGGGEHSFAFEVAVEGPGILAGEWLTPDGSGKFEYSLSRREGGITGVVKSYRRSEPEGPYHPPDEWVFEVEER